MFPYNKITKLLAGIFFITTLITSCKKTLTGKPVSFDVTADSSSYTPGSLSRFKFTGNPDIITFYSGQWGQRYAYKDRISDTSGNCVLSFSSAINAAGTSGNMSLLLSNDFNGDTSKVANATWTDVSNQIAWATNSTVTPSGNINLNNYKTIGKPVWIAFKYAADPGVSQRKWTVSNMLLTHQAINDTSFTLANFSVTVPVFAPGAPSLVASPGWVAVNYSRNPTSGQRWSPAVSATNTTSFSIAGTTNASIAIASEQWIIAGPVALSRVLRDVPTAVVKNLMTNAENITPLFNYKYPAKGIYNAVFLGQNVNADFQHSLERWITVVVN
jgi:hypothetical protein